MVAVETAIARIEKAARAVDELPNEDGHHVLVPGDGGRLVRYYADLVALTGREIEGAVALDAGCGTGGSSLVLAALGASTVHAVDLDAGKIAALERSLPAAEELGAALRPAAASVFELPLPSASVDLILSNEAIGVYRDVGAFLDECARVLRPGGAVVMAEINDVLNRRLRARARRLWRAYELGPPGVHDGHPIESPYVEQRAQLAREVLPGAPAEIAEQIAARTFRCDAAQVRAACERWEATGELPSSPYDPDRAPGDLHGVLVEAPVDPKWMREALRARGMEPRVAGYWGGVHGNPVVRALNGALRATGPLALPTARSIRYIGRKP